MIPLGTKLASPRTILGPARNTSFFFVRISGVNLVTDRNSHFKQRLRVSGCKAQEDETEGGGEGEEEGLGMLLFEIRNISDFVINLPSLLKLSKNFRQVHLVRLILSTITGPVRRETTLKFDRKFNHL